MSYDRSPPSPPSVLSPQYATATEEPSTSGSFSTMPSSPSDSTILSHIQLYSTRLPKTWISPICGAGAGFASGIVTCPLDVIKTKLQAQGGFATRRPGQFTGSAQAYNGMIG